MEVLCWSSTLGGPVSQLSLFTATFILSDNPPHKADDGLNSRPLFITEIIKHQLSLLRLNYNKSCQIFKASSKSRSSILANLVTIKVYPQSSFP